MPRSFYPESLKAGGEMSKRRRMSWLLLGAAFCLLLACGCGSGHKKSRFPDDGQIYTPVKVEGGIEGGGKGGTPVGTHLSSIQVKPVDPPDNEEAASIVETVMAFKNVGKFADCEKEAEGTEPVEGTIVIQFGLDEDGRISEEPSIVLTTSSQQGGMEECLEKVVGKIDFSGVSLQSPSTFHVLLKYGL
jgi:hypothetical protein